MAFKAGKLHDEDNSPPAPVQVANDEEDVESQPIPRTQHHFFKKSFFWGISGVSTCLARVFCSVLGAYLVYALTDLPRKAAQMFYY